MILRAEAIRRRDVADEGLVRATIADLAEADPLVSGTAAVVLLRLPAPALERALEAADPVWHDGAAAPLVALELAARLERAIEVPPAGDEALVLSRCAELLARQGGVAELLDGLASHAHWAVRTRLATGLGQGKTDDETAVRLLAPLTQDTHPTVRRAAEAALHTRQRGSGSDADGTVAGREN